MTSPPICLAGACTGPFNGRCSSLALWWYYEACIHAIHGSISFQFDSFASLRKRRGMVSSTCSLRYCWVLLPHRAHTHMRSANIDIIPSILPTLLAASANTIIMLFDRFQDQAGLHSINITIISLSTFHSPSTIIISPSSSYWFQAFRWSHFASGTSVIRLTFKPFIWWRHFEVFYAGILNSQSLCHLFPSSLLFASWYPHLGEQRRKESVTSLFVVDYTG